jgi:hypothetical protein
VYDHFWSDRNYMDLRDQAHSALEDIAGVSTGRGSLARDDGTPEEIGAAGRRGALWRTLNRGPAAYG